MVHMTSVDLVVSPLCLGCAVIGSTFDQNESFDLLDYYMEMGGNFLDTAHNYADWAYPEKSISEKTIGRWMKSRKNREQVVVGTKVAQIDLSSMHVRIRREEIITDVKECLQCLQTDYIDLLWLHRDDITIPVEDIVGTLTELKKTGLIRSFGFSNWDAANQPMWSCARINKERLGDQTQRTMDDEMFRFHHETKLTAVPYTSQASGYFSKLASGNVRNSLTNLYGNEENLKRMERIKRCSEETGLSVNDISLAYLRSQPFPTVPIIGFKNKEQLSDNLQKMNLTLPSAMVEFIRGDGNLF